MIVVIIFNEIISAVIKINVIAKKRVKRAKEQEKYNSKEEREEFFSYGAFEVFSKPADLDDLLACLQLLKMRVTQEQAVERDQKL